MYKEKVILSLVRFFTRRYNIRRPGGLEGVSRCIVDARKANLHSHAYTYIHTEVIINVVVAVVCLLSFFCIHLGSEKDDEKRKWSFLFCSFFSVLLSWIASSIVCACVALWKAISWQLDARICTFARSLYMVFAYCLHSILWAKKAKARKDAQG